MMITEKKTASRLLLSSPLLSKEAWKWRTFTTTFSPPFYPYIHDELLSSLWRPKFHFPSGPVHFLKNLWNLEIRETSLEETGLLHLLRSSSTIFNLCVTVVLVVNFHGPSQPSQHHPPLVFLISVSCHHEREDGDVKKLLFCQKSFTFSPNSFQLG